MQNLELHDTGIIADTSTLKLGLKLILAFNINTEMNFSIDLLVNICVIMLWIFCWILILINMKRCDSILQNNWVRNKLVLNSKEETSFIIRKNDSKTCTKV